MPAKHQDKPTSMRSFSVFKSTEQAVAIPNQYKGETVTVQRDAQKGDAGFVEGTDQVLVVFADGSTRIVKRSEVS